jgi:hypothetical protein
MAYVWQRWLADEFRKAGLRVVEVEGWKDRGRPASTGNFDPARLAVHHTGWTSSAREPAPGIRTLVEGRPDLPGPLCQFAVAHDGSVYVIAAGRANVNGRVGKSGVKGWPLGVDGNAIGMGDEVITNGTQPLPEAQRKAIALTNSVVLEHFGTPTDELVRHEDISGSGKWDIGQLTTQQVREDCNAIREDDMADAATQKKLDDILEGVNKIREQATKRNQAMAERQRKILEATDELAAVLAEQNVKNATKGQVKKVRDLVEALTDEGA